MTSRDASEVGPVDRAGERVTIYQVADRAGVSIATVSRALRGSDLVTPSTRQRILAVIEELNYTPSRAGRSLAEGQHAASGIVFPDLVGPYYAEVVLGYEEVAAELGRSVLILAAHNRPDAADRALGLAGRVDGMAIMGRTVSDEVVARIAGSGLPVVLLARPAVADVDTVSTENESTARQLAAHLLGHGYTRIGFLGDPTASPDVAGRYAGITAVLREAGAPEPTAVPCAFDIDAGQAAAAQLLAARTKPQAVICANDELALGVLTAADRAGLRVPRDLAVTGWDDVMAARFAGLTTVRQPMRELGATAARWLHNRITQRTSGRRDAADPAAGAPARHQVLPTELVIRASCGDHSATKEATP